MGFSQWPIALSRTQAPNDAGRLYAISSLPDQLRDLLLNSINEGIS